MHRSHVHFGAAVLGAVVAEVVLIAAAFGWVAIYSHLINPGQPLPVYEQHALDSGPYVSILAGILIFYAIGRWIARTRPTALIMCGLVLTFDFAVLVLTSFTSLLPIAGLVAASYLTKVAAAWWGSRPGAPAPDSQPR